MERLALTWRHGSEDRSSLNGKLSDRDRFGELFRYNWLKINRVGVASLLENRKTSGV